MVSCCIKGCKNRDNKHSASNVSFYRIPMNCSGRGTLIRELTAERRSLWLLRINHTDIHDGARVCSDHFISG